MAEISIAQEQQKKLKASKMRRNQTFAELMNFSKVEAAQYAIDCGINTQIDGISAQEYVKLNGRKVELDEEDKEDEKEDKKEELSKSELQELLKINNIDFLGTFGQKKLLEIAQNNGLL